MSKSKHSEQAKAGEEAKPAAQPLPESAPAAAAEQELVADEIGKLNDQILRLRADFDNLRRRTRREQVEAGDRIRAEMLGGLLPIVDHFELGLKSAQAAAGVPESVLKGFQMVMDQFRGLLDRSGVVPIDAEGQAFDPAFHECIAHTPSESAAEGTVIAQTRRGYRLGQAVLRAAQVIVSSGPAAAAAAPEGAKEGAG